MWKEEGDPQRENSPEALIAEFEHFGAHEVDVLLGGLVRPLGRCQLDALMCPGVGADRNARPPTSQVIEELRCLVWDT